MISRIKEERIKRNISQRELAKLCGVTQCVIARIESGKVEPNYSTLKKIMDALKLEMVIKTKSENFNPLARWNDLFFMCYWKDEPVAEVSVKENDVYIKRFIKHPIKQIFYKDVIDVYALSKILQSRCWEESRVGIDDILMKLGVKYYDPLEIVKKTHGVSYNDFLWFQFSGEHLYWKDVCPRSN